jgi:hypothetical protein
MFRVDLFCASTLPPFQTNREGQCLDWTKQKNINNREVKKVKEEGLKYFILLLRLFLSN